MAGIVLPSGESWMVSRWIFRHVLDEVEGLYPEDKQLVEALRRGEANDLLNLTRLEPAVRARLEKALLDITQRPTPIETAPDAVEGDERFVRAVQSLEQLLSRDTSPG